MNCCSYMTIQNTSILEMFILFFIFKHKNVYWLAMGTKVFSFVHLVKNTMEIINVLLPFSLDSIWGKKMFCNWSCNSIFDAKNTYNSLYLYVVNVNEQVAWVAELQLIVYTMQLITTQLQFNQNNLFSTVMQFHYNCIHDVMLTSLVVVHLLKFDTSHYEDFWT